MTATFFAACICYPQILEAFKDSRWLRTHVTCHIYQYVLKTRISHQPTPKLGNVGSHLWWEGWWAHLEGQAQWGEIATPLPMLTTPSSPHLQHGHGEPVGMQKVTSEFHGADPISEDHMRVLGLLLISRCIHASSPSCWSLTHLSSMPPSHGCGKAPAFPLLYTSVNSLFFLVFFPGPSDNLHQGTFCCLAQVLLLSWHFRYLAALLWVSICVCVCRNIYRKSSISAHISNTHVSCKEPENEESCK